MSIEEMKQRFAAVPGIENLTMRIEGGLEVFSVGGGFVSLKPGATDAELEAALRGIAPTSSALPLVTLGVQAGSLPAAPSVAASATPATAHMTIKDMMAAHMRTMVEIQDAQAALLAQSLKRQVDAVSTAVGSVSDKIDGQTDDFLAMMGQFTNSLG